MFITKTTTVQTALAKLLLVLLCTSCSHVAQRRDHYIRSYRHGDIRQAREQVDKLVAERMPEAGYERCGDAPWLLLDQGMLAFAQDDIPKAVDSLRRGLEAIDFYRQSVSGESLGQVLLDDRARAYAASTYEEILARLYLAWALYANGDSNNAYAILRQAEERQAQLELSYPIAKLLFGIALQQNGDYSNARILFEQASNAVPEQRPLLVVVNHSGAVPLKTSITLPGSQIAGWMVEDILAATGQNNVRVSTIAGVPVPGYAMATEIPGRSVSVLLDGRLHKAHPVCDVSALAVRELEAEQPLIAARGAARILIRRAAVAATDRADETAGTVLDLLALVANLATQADTRSWATLPARIDIALIPVSAGYHELSVTDGSHYSAPLRIDISDGDVAFIHTFTQNYPGSRQILMRAPKQLIVSEEDTYETAS